MEQKTEPKTVQQLVLEREIYRALRESQLTVVQQDEVLAWVRAMGLETGWSLASAMEWAKAEEFQFPATELAKVLFLARARALVVLELRLDSVERLVASLPLALQLTDDLDAIFFRLQLLVSSADRCPDDAVSALSIQVGFLRQLRRVLLRHSPPDLEMEHALLLASLFPMLQKVSRSRRGLTGNFRTSGVALRPETGLSKSDLRELVQEEHC